MNDLNDTITNEELLLKLNKDKTPETYALMLIDIPEEPIESPSEKKRPRFNFNFKNKKSKRTFMLAAAAIALALITLVYLVSFGNSKYEGIAKPSVYPQIVKVSAEVLNISVGVGQEVKKGEVLATLDKTDQLFALKELEFALEKMEVSLNDSKMADMTNTTENSNVILAEAKYNQAVAVANQAAQDYANALVLLSEGVLPQSEVDNYSKVADKAYEAVDAAKAELNLAKNSATTASLLIDIEKTKGEIAKLKSSMKDYEIRASHAGTIEKIGKVEGDMVSPGDHLLELATPEEMFLEVPSTEALKNKIKYNQVVKFEFDSIIYQGKVKHLDSKKIKVSIPTNCPIGPDQKAKIFF